MDANIIGALIGLVSGILGSLIGGFISYRTLRAQLEHEAKEKERERQLTLRRDVYLEAMEAIGKSQMILGSFSREDFDPSKFLDRLEEIPGTLAKTQLVTSEGTFEALEKFGDFMVSSCVDLLDLRLRAKNLQDEIEDHQRQISQLQQRYENFLVFIQEAGPQDQRQPHALTELIRIQEAQASEQAILQELSSRQLEATKVLGKKAVEATLDAQIEVVRLIVEIRKEIELPLREEWCLERSHKRKARLMPKVDEAYRNVAAIFDEKRVLEESVAPSRSVPGKGALSQEDFATEALANEDPAAPAPGDVQTESVEDLSARDLANFGAPGEEEEAEEPFAVSEETGLETVTAPTIALDLAQAQAFLDACVNSVPRVTYGLGAKVPFHGAVPGRDFQAVDCSGFIRELIWRATTPHLKFPDGSVVQHDFVRDHGFERSTPQAALNQDGVVRIAFLRPQDSPQRIGHVVLVHNARTLESHGGVGPDSRAWTNTGWQVKAFVYVVKP